MSADLALQKALRARLVATGAVTALVPAASILDANQRPAPSPSIIIGEGQAIEGDRLDRRDQRLVLTLHVWKKEPGITGVKAIAGAIRAALSLKFEENDGYHFADCRVSSMRFLRDPDGETAHGVVTVEALVCEVAP
ncbi:DUF3168 domain-containing protein [Mesorhizobium sp. PUT5]|uniref:DUF3168 domain-containing protein n=1 Tax=Mesorhizobium sp. PUT5 TaxID=3454629 RepID=UPI003FA4C706